MPPGAPKADPRRGPRRILRAVLFSCVPLVVLLAALELVLRVFDWGGAEGRLSLARGFDPRAHYLVPDAGRPGGWRTQVFENPADEVAIPPRDGGTRVLLFGGSNTRLFSAEDLAAQLDAAAPGVRHEVVNLGCPGYGSERVLILLRQALDDLDPDILVVYCGHNEFVEAGFAAELAQSWDQPWFRRLASAAQHLRTVNLLVELASSTSGPSPGADAGAPADPRAAAGNGAADGRPEPRGDRQEMMDLRYEQTLLFYDVYRDNLRAMCDAAEAHGVGLVLCTVVGNMLAPPVVPRHAAELSAQDGREFNRLRNQCFERLPARLVRGLSGAGKDGKPTRLRWDDWGEHLLAADRYVRPEREPQTPPALRRLLPPLDGAPLWTDPALWNPRVFELLGTASAFLARDLSPDERRAVAEATDLARRAVDLSPGHAQAVFDLGLCLYLGGATDEALQCLHRAATLDCSPNRGNDLTNGVVREVAAEHPEAAFVDADRLFEGRSPDALVTYELLMDNCHLHPGARHALMQDLVPPLRRLAEERSH